MKQFALVLMLLGAVVSSRAGITATNLITYQSISGTNSGTAIAVSTIQVPTKTVLVQNSGLSNTNQLTGYLELSVDGTNYGAVATYRPASTNATMETFAPNLGNITLYLRFRVVTTNAVSVGATAVSSTVF